MCVHTDSLVSIFFFFYKITKNIELKSILTPRIPTVFIKKVNESKRDGE